MPSPLKADPTREEDRQAAEYQTPPAAGNARTGKIRDASAKQGPYPDPGSLDEAGFAASVRQPIRVGAKLADAAGRHKVTAGELNTTLRALTTLVTHATDDELIFRRRPDDVRTEFELPRRQFFRLCAAAEAVGCMKREPGGMRGVVEYRMPRGVPRVALLATKSAQGGTARATKSAQGGTARGLPTFTDQDDHHHHQGELASRNQIRKACALDRAAGRTPDEARYAAMPRLQLWDLIAELERQQMGRSEPAPAPEPAPKPSAEELAKRRDHGRELLNKIATREGLIDHPNPQVRGRVAAELAQCETEYERLTRGDDD